MVTPYFHHNNSVIVLPHERIGNISTFLLLLTFYQHIRRTHFDYLTPLLQTNIRRISPIHRSYHPSNTLIVAGRRSTTARNSILTPQFLQTQPSSKKPASSAPPINTHLLFSPYSSFVSLRVSGFNAFFCLYIGNIALRYFDL
jgi:hypothetical protein